MLRYMETATTAVMIDAVDEVLEATLDLARTLSERDADRPTGCPGWSVRDQLSHMVGLEQVLGGAPHPDIALPPLEHVRNDVATYMEQQVHVRRGLPLVSVADELAGMRARRIAQYRRALAEGDPTVPAPLGSERSLSKALPVRVLDLWAHEQDIRRAVGVPLRVDGLSGPIAAQRTLAAWASVLSEPLFAADAKLEVAVDELGPDAVTTIGDGGRRLRLQLGIGTLTALGFGRGVAREHLGDAEVTGDADVLAELAEHFAFTP